MVLTPEEWVRQNFILYLTEALAYPLALIAVEKQILLQEIKKRFDIVVYDKNIKPLILVECKEMGVPIDRKVLDQVLVYQSSLQAQTMVITNGNQTYAFGQVEGVWQELEILKSWAD